MNPNKTVINELKSFIEKKLNFIVDTNLNIQSKLDAKLSGFQDEISNIKKAISFSNSNKQPNWKSAVTNLLAEKRLTSLKAKASSNLKFKGKRKTSIK